MQFDHNIVDFTYEMSPTLSIEDRARIAARYEVWQSVVQVQRWWRSQHGRHSNLDPKTIKNCYRKLMTTGSVLDSARSGRPSTKSDADVELVREMFDRSPSKSTRQAARESGICRHTILNVLHEDLRYRQWKPHYVQQLFPEDCDRRVEFCETMLAWFEDCPELSSKILWTDEAVFRVGGFVNRHNCHYWCESDPKEITERCQNRPTVTVWCGLSSTRILGPYIIRDTMNSQRYLHMLENFVWPTITEWEEANELIFMQDGAPPHYALTVRTWLDDHFPGRWMGRRGPTDWPARSPDFTPCDFFLWGWAKEEVYETSPRTIDKLENRIREVIENVPPEFLRSATEQVSIRLRQCIHKDGAHI